MSASNARPLLPICSGRRNITSKSSGSLPTRPSAPRSTAQSSAPRSSFPRSSPSSPAGKSRSPSRGTPTAISTRRSSTASPARVKRSWSSPMKAVRSSPGRPSMTSRAPACCRRCTTGTTPSCRLPAAALPTRCRCIRTSGSQARTRSPRTMIRPSSSCSRRSLTRNSRANLKPPAFTIATHSSTTWLRRSSAPRAA